MALELLTQKRKFVPKQCSNVEIRGKAGNRAERRRGRFEPDGANRAHLANLSSSIATGSLSARQG